jgi:hypothetical protein
MTELSTRDGLGANHWLVFTSAGDRGRVQRWFRGRRGFDLWVTYYGDAAGKLESVADLYNVRRGSKFQNLHYAYSRWPEIVTRYSAVMVLDDDIEISGAEIARLFECLEGYELWALQPAFSPWGKVSWPITRVRRWSKLRYTNFVELTCPLFRADKLEDFMRVYDPVLVGWGCDWWFMHVMGPGLEGRVAIVDDVVCLNPPDLWKGGGREIDRVQEPARRRATWERIKLQHGIRCDERGTVEYGSIPKPWLRRLLGQPATLAEGVVLAGLGQAQRLLRRLRLGESSRGII